MPLETYRQAIKVVIPTDFSTGIYFLDIYGIVDLESGGNLVQPPAQCRICKKMMHQQHP